MPTADYSLIGGIVFVAFWCGVYALMSRDPRPPKR